MSFANRTIFINILTSFLSMIANTVVMLYIFRLANQRIGVEQIGLWSIINTIASFGSIGTFGITSSMIKFAAEYQSRGEREKITGLLNSSILIMAALVLLFIGILYLLAIIFIKYFVDIKYLNLALQLIPISFLIFFISTISYLILSVVEGLNLAWQRNIIMILSYGVFLLSAASWIDEYGIYSLFFAQLAQMFMLFVFSFILVKVNISTYTILSFSNDSETLKRITNYGLKFQSAMIFQMFGEPATKFFLSRYGGLGYVGVFEMASRIVIQIRSLIVTITSNLLPKLVDVHVRKRHEAIVKYFNLIYNFNFILFSAAFGLLAIVAPIIVYFWLGENNTTLVWFIRLFCFSWFLNAQTIVPYIFNLSSGILKGNVVSNALSAFFNIGICVVIALLNLSPVWFVIGWCISLVMGSLYILYEYNTRFNGVWRNLVEKENLIISLIILIHVGVILFISLFSQINNFNVILIGLSFVFIMAFYVLKTKTFRFIYQFIFK